MSRTIAVRRTARGLAVVLAAAALACTAPPATQEAPTQAAATPGERPALLFERVWTERPVALVGERVDLWVVPSGRTPDLDLRWAGSASLGLRTTARDGTRVSIQPEGPPGLKQLGAALVRGRARFSEAWGGITLEAPLGAGDRLFRGTTDAAGTPLLQAEGPGPALEVTLHPPADSPYQSSMGGQLEGSLWRGDGAIPAGETWEVRSQSGRSIHLTSTPWTREAGAAQTLEALEQPVVRLEQGVLRTGAADSLTEGVWPESGLLHVLPRPWPSEESVALDADTRLWLDDGVPMVARGEAPPRRLGGRPLPAGLSLSVNDTEIGWATHEGATRQDLADRRARVLRVGGRTDMPPAMLEGFTAWACGAPDARLCVGTQGRGRIDLAPPGASEGVRHPTALGDWLIWFTVGSLQQVRPDLGLWRSMSTVGARWGPPGHSAVGPLFERWDADGRFAGTAAADLSSGWPEPLALATPERSPPQTEGAAAAEFALLREVPVPGAETPRRHLLLRDVAVIEELSPSVRCTAAEDEEGPGYWLRMPNHSHGGQALALALGTTCQITLHVSGPGQYELLAWSSGASSLPAFSLRRTRSPLGEDGTAELPVTEPLRQRGPQRSSRGWSSLFRAELTPGPWVLEVEADGLEGLLDAILFRRLPVSGGTMLAAPPHTPDPERR